MAKARRAKSVSIKTPQFAGQARVVLAGSAKAPVPNAVLLKDTPARSKLTVSLIVKRKEPLKINRRGDRANGPVRLSRTEYKKHHAADPDAVKQVRAFARQFNLKVELDPTSTVRRTIQLTGSAADIQKATDLLLKYAPMTNTASGILDTVISVNQNVQAGNRSTLAQNLWLYQEVQQNLAYMAQAQDYDPGMIFID